MAENAENVPILRPLINGGIRKNERPKEPWKGEFVKSIVYAGLDAIITSFSLISSISAGRLSSVDVLVLGFANLVADGISMGFGDFMSSSTEKDVAAKERCVAEWDVENRRGTQQEELARRYQELGMNATDAAMVVSILGKYPEILVDEKMSTVAPEETEKPWKNGLITFVAFLVFGCAPILAFIVLIPFTDNDQIKFVGAHYKKIVDYRRRNAVGNKRRPPVNSVTGGVTGGNSPSLNGSSATPLPTAIGRRRQLTAASPPVFPPLNGGRVAGKLPTANAVAN